MAQGTRVGVRITGTGAYLPPRVVTNHDLEQMVETTDEWIRSRTGIRERHLAGPEESTSDLGARAAERALAAAGLAATEVDLIVVATITPDKMFPNTACLVQRKIGASRAICFSLEAACSGFVYGFEVVSCMLRCGTARNALLIGAEKLSAILNWEDRSTCVLFGDGAGAVVVQTCDPADDMLVASSLGSDGRYHDLLHVPGGGAAMPFSQEVLDNRSHFLQMSGPEIFKLAVTSMCEAAEEVLRRGGIGVHDVRWLIPHQANTRIITSVVKKLGIAPERAYVNLERFGNTSAATIPIALDEIVRQELVRRGDYLLLVAFGGGLTWGANLIRW